MKVNDSNVYSLILTICSKYMFEVYIKNYEIKTRIMSLFTIQHQIEVKYMFIDKCKFIQVAGPLFRWNVVYQKEWWTWQGNGTTARPIPAENQSGLYIYHQFNPLDNLIQYSINTCLFYIVYVYFISIWLL